MQSPAKLVVRRTLGLLLASDFIKEWAGKALPTGRGWNPGIVSVAV